MNSGKADLKATRNANAFVIALPDDKQASQMIYQKIQEGIARFSLGDLTHEDGDELGDNGFLLAIKPGDWLVFVHQPVFGQCVAVKTLSTYKKDTGLPLGSGFDYTAYFQVDTQSQVAFDLKDNRLIPGIHFQMRKRVQRIFSAPEFIDSLTRINDLANVKRGKSQVEIRNQHLFSIIEEFLQKLEKGYGVQSFFKEIFSQIKHVRLAAMGFSHEADPDSSLILDLEHPIEWFDVPIRMAVHVKSKHKGKLTKLAVEQLILSMKKYDCDSGLLITLAEETEEIEKYIRKRSFEIGKAIYVMTGIRTARFILKHGGLLN